MSTVIELTVLQWMGNMWTGIATISCSRKTAVELNVFFLLISLSIRDDSIGVLISP
jgi:hypothetical protein